MEIVEAINLYRDDGATALILGIAFYVAYQTYHFHTWLRKREITINDTLQAEVRILHKEISDFKSEMINKVLVHESELISVLKQNHEATAKNLAMAKQIWEEARRVLKIRGAAGSDLE